MTLRNFRDFMPFTGEGQQDKPRGDKKTGWSEKAVESGRSVNDLLTLSPGSPRAAVSRLQSQPLSSPKPPGSGDLKRWRWCKAT
jgi:hypothetical protein